MSKYVSTMPIPSLLGSNISTPGMISYKGVDVTFDDLDKLIARKKIQKPSKPKSKERVVFDGNYTIYYDKYGKKTVVSRMPEDEYDAEKAVLYALLKSKGVKPKEVARLIDNAADKQAKRIEKSLKKIAKSSKQLAQMMEDFDLEF